MVHLFVSCVGLVFSASQYSVEDAARVRISCTISSMVTRSSTACSNTEIMNRWCSSLLPTQSSVKPNCAHPYACHQVTKPARNAHAVLMKQLCLAS